MSAETCELVFEIGTLRPIAVVDAIHKVLTTSNGSVRAERYGKAIDPLKHARDLTSQGTRHLAFSINNVDIRLTPVVNHGIDVLVFQAPEAPTADWIEWIMPLASDSRFISAWIEDSNYRHWQNTTDPTEYQEAGKPLPGPLIRRNAPPPLDDLIVDCSNNPGRMVLQSGYVEAVGSRMWLGTLFCDHTGASPIEIEQTPWLRTSRPHPDILEIQSADQPFTSSVGAQAETQVALRKLLFPRVSR